MMTSLQFSVLAVALCISVQAARAQDVQLDPAPAYREGRPSLLNSALLPLASDRGRAPSEGERRKPNFAGIDIDPTPTGAIIPRPVEAPRAERGGPRIIVPKPSAIDPGGVTFVPRADPPAENSEHAGESVLLGATKVVFPTLGLPSRTETLSVSTEKNALPIEPELPPAVEPPVVRVQPPTREIPVEPAPPAPKSEPVPPPLATKPAEIAAPTLDLATFSTAIEAELSARVTSAERMKPLGAMDWRAIHAAVQTSYAQRSFKPLFVDEHGLMARGRDVLAQLRRAPADGLDISALESRLPSSALGADTKKLAEAEVTLAIGVAAYAAEASGARIAPGRIADVFEKPDVVAPAKALAIVAAADDAGSALQDFNPPQRGYRELRDAFARLHGDAVAQKPVPPGPTLHVGMIDVRVALIRARLGIESEVAAEPAVYDVRVATAIADFQRSRGLPASGFLNPATAEALSGGDLYRREAAVLANMELWRWQPREPGAMRVEVNVPDFSVRLMSGDSVVHRARVIVGKPDTPTPIFSNAMRYLLINPSWLVPESIIKKEMMPKLEKDPDYLTRRGFEVTEVGGKMMVRQPPGEGNALGHILFMFPNDHSVYLHDTPSRGLFSSAFRALSHGCVRVDQPLRLGELVMGGVANGWSEARIQSRVGTGEQTVFLPHPIPIHIQYFTTFVDESGTLQRRADVYGIERQVANALSLKSQD